MSKLVFICKGCGVTTNDPDKQMDLYRRAGCVSCCPERDMRPAYATDGDGTPDKVTLNEVWSLAIAEAADRAAYILGADDIDADSGYHVAEEIRRLRKPYPRQPIGRDEIMALFFKHGGKPLGRTIDNLGVTPEQLFAFATDLIVRTELRTLAAGR